MAIDPWLLLTNLIAHPGTGALNLIDPAAPLLPKRFYRFNLP